MDTELFYKYLTDDFVLEGKLYTPQNIPYQIGQAIYLYGNNNIKDIIAFIDFSHLQDGTSGMIFTPTHIYYQFDQPQSFSYQDILSLSLEKHRHDIAYKALVKTKTNHYFFTKHINTEKFIYMLSDITHLHIDMILTMHEKIDYYTSIILNDIINDAYEDVKLTSQQNLQINEFYQELDIIHQLDDENYQYELEKLCPRVLQFFDELELDSDEIDILFDVQNTLEQNHSHEFDQAQAFYDDMMNKYRSGDTSMFAQMKGMMDNLGIHLDDFKNKSPEELDQYINELCDRFNISRAQLDAMIQKYR